MSDALNYGAKEDFSEDLIFKWQRSWVYKNQNGQRG